MRLATPPGLRPDLPLEPLLPWIRRAALPLVGDRDGDLGLSELARRYAVRFGRKPSSVERQMERMVSGTFRLISEARADEWCLFLGLHLDVVWPDEDVAA